MNEEDKKNIDTKFKEYNKRLDWCYRYAAFVFFVLLWAIYIAANK